MKPMAPMDTIYHNNAAKMETLSEILKRIDKFSSVKKKKGTDSQN